MELSESIINKIKGVIYGQVIGDALGLGAEFLAKEEVKKYYANGLSDYSQIIKDKHRSRWVKGEWTDDTEQFLCIMDSLIYKGKVDLKDIAGRFYNWYKNEPRGIGYTTLKVLSMPQYVQYPQKAAHLVWKLKGENVAPNGALMRNAITGMWHYYDQKQVHFNSSEICKLTHYDQRCVESCIIHSHIISSELKNGRCDVNYLQEFVNTLDPRIKTYLIEYLSEDICSLELGDSKGMGYTLKSLSAALWAYLYTNSFEEGILAIINEGGDADTNGCIAGSVLGAKFGYDTIPKRWIEGIHNVKEIENRVDMFLEIM
jgi:ADP-ribosylglycohydrolase